LAAAYGLRSSELVHLKLDDLDWRHDFAHRLRDSGLAAPPTGSHVLRHSLAVELLRQRVSLKAIGDVFGHRHAASTLNYVRLSADDLRMAGLEVPQEPIEG
jgi:site-specific recombinase XerD